MKIAIVLFKYNPYGGYERQAALLADTLGKRGDDVTVFTSLWSGDDAVKQFSGGGAVRMKKVPVTKLASWMKVSSFAKNSKTMIEEDEMAPFDCVVAFDRTRVMDIYRAGNACHREWIEFRKKHGTVRDRLSIALNPLHTIINGIEERIFNRIATGRAHAVVLAEKGAEEIERHYPLGNESFTTVPPGIDFEGRFGALDDETKRDEARAAVRTGIGAGADTLLILHVGSGFRIKGVRNTIGAVARLADKGLDPRLLVVGSDKKETARLSDYAAALAVSDRVRFVGGKKDVGPYYAAADMFVVPSLFETFGAVFMEALWWGLPVIVGAGAGAARFIESRDAGSVIEVPADEKELAELIVKTADNEKRLREAGEIEKERQRRRSVALECSSGAVMEKFIKLIDVAAAGKNSGGADAGN